MIVYEITNPSDMATFLAPDREIALVALVFIGEGAYGGKPLSCDGKTLSVVDAESAEVPIFLFGGYEAWWKANGWTEEPVEKVLRERKSELVAALRSASYGDLEDRRTYDAACAAITDPEKLAAFRQSCEDRRRSSMNRIVHRAWAYADAIEKREAA